MGMQEMREELEDLAFRELNPEAYATITERLERSPSASRAAGSTEIERAADAEARRQRHRRRGHRPAQARLFDLAQDGAQGRSASSSSPTSSASASWSTSVDECYRALGIVHTTWPVVPGRFKDYISTPKQNDYRSIHTTVIGPGKQRVELQIRTREMHQIAEYGIAAHALYKDGLGSPTEHAVARESNAYAWLRRTIELLAEGDNPEEFLEHTKLELFQDQVFCFTPKGQLIALPRGATPIDFAYAVHTDVGNMAVGAKINGQIAPLVSELQNGDEVEIITLEGAGRAAGGLGIDRRHRQGARRDPAGDARRRCARSIPGSAGTSSSGLSSAPRSPTPTRSCKARCRGSPAASIDDVMSRGRPRRDEGVRRRARDVSRLQGRAAWRRARRSRKAAGSA